ncbi:MAG TPA: hypothetical protein VGK18_04815 [Propionicimonas sp.]|uniref:hypothetical protein n=1 Tax=Propionicimonas sp. TaxID=1955623 RepID=UPI002F3FF1A7
MANQGPHDPPPGVIDWLLDGDPSVRWQVLADLLDAPPDEVDRVRSQVATQGWGAALLARQDPDGRWAQGLYSPKSTSTTYTLLLLQRLGLPSGDERALTGVRLLWDGAQYCDGGLTLASSIGQPEACITAMLVGLAAGFGHNEPRVPAAVEWLVRMQLADGGWNCRTVRDGSRHGSFHTTILVLEALLTYARAAGTVPVGEQLAEGRRFLLEHRLCRSHRTGELVDSRYLRFPFPPGWHYDVVRGLEHFRAAGAPPDPRLQDGVDAIERLRLADGRWPRHAPYAGKYWFPLEPSGPSRLSTLRALRILRWWRPA